MSSPENPAFTLELPTSTTTVASSSWATMSVRDLCPCVSLLRGMRISSRILVQFSVGMIQRNERFRRVSTDCFVHVFHVLREGVLSTSHTSAQHTTLHTALDSTTRAVSLCPVLAWHVDRRSGGGDSAVIYNYLWRRLAVCVQISLPWAQRLCFSTDGCA